MLVIETSLCGSWFGQFGKLVSSNLYLTFLYICAELIFMNQSHRCFISIKMCCKKQRPVNILRFSLNHTYPSGVTMMLSEFCMSQNICKIFFVVFCSKELEGVFFCFFIHLLFFYFYFNNVLIPFLSSHLGSFCFFFFLNTIFVTFCLNLTKAFKKHLHFSPLQENGLY